MKLTQEKLPRFSLTKTFIINLSLTASIASPTLANTQSTNSANYTLEIKQIPLISIQKDPPGRGTPPSQEGTGSRGDCLYKQDKPPLTRLVGGLHSKLTVNQHPTMWVYIPYTHQEAPSGKFSLQDENNEIYKTSFQLPDRPGIMSISLPSTVDALEPGKRYRWYLDITCPNTSNSQVSPSRTSLTGIVEIVTPSSALENELKSAVNGLERIKIYIKYGIWIDALTELAQLRLNQPQNSTFQKIWVELLTQPQIGLANVAKEPIIANFTASYLLK
ncbi:MAG: DUF928 domain-containing protein [Mojavia pulchra JT2-VF2]|jgi:hypothetical protein|uniref:DUF928 domain-containing protein n=1 Tax=Mojavia pulchra JT2-VF2 TaxID=287848 RepID=A0A951PZ98_9NOST|nr:DUF928 domain-containing protein [Mojavia pulchra JT2-VF2]